jgi:cytochrome P450
MSCPLPRTSTASRSGSTRADDLQEHLQTRIFEQPSEPEDAEGHVKLADCPVFPDEAATALSTDRGLGWRLAREAGPVLRHSAANGMFANWVFVVGREEVLANLDDARLDRARALPESDLEVHQQLFAPKAAHDIAAAFRPTAVALIDRFAAAGGGDAVADVTTPMASTLFGIVAQRQLLPFEHLSGPSGHVLFEACCNLFKHASWHLFELARRPELCDMLRRQPEVIRRFVEEVLRLEPMVQSCQRFTTQPTTVGEVELPADVTVMLCFAAVQRDGSDAMSTDDLVISDRAHRHWSLGAGSMRCRGGHIVRQVLRVLVEEWVDRAGHVGLVPAFRPAAGFPATQSVLCLPRLPLVTRV